MTGSGDRQGREPTSASFEATRVPARRGSPPLFILGFVLFVGAFVAVGVGGRSAPEPTLPPEAVDSPAVTVAPSSVTVRSARPPAAHAQAVGSRTFTSGAGPVQLEATRGARTVFVHGDVFVPRTTWVYVSLRDEAGNVAGWASVSVPGAAGPAQGTGPNLRFDVELTLPDGFAGPLLISANAYDASSAVIASGFLEAGPLVLSRIENEP